MKLLAVIAMLVACSSAESTPAPPAPSKPPDAPHIAKHWTGQGIKTTEPFTIRTGRWRIRWKNAPTTAQGYLGITVHAPGNQVPLEIAANTVVAGSDESYVYRTGEFVLMINAANTKWDVSVDELDPGS